MYVQKNSLKLFAFVREINGEDVENQEYFISESIFFAFCRSLEKIFTSIPPKGFKPTTFSSTRKDSIPSSRSLFWAKLAANESLKILRTTISSLLCVIIYFSLKVQ